MPQNEQLPLEPEKPWFREITTYQWIVLIVACAGWIFDIYENQIFMFVRGDMLGQLLRKAPNSPEVKAAGESINSLFLVGGAIGGVGFGMIADRFGRSRAMVLSILVYAGFSSLTAFATSVWQVAVLRFLVATGTGGEWAVAAALVSEVFPKRARAHASAIFHASSVLGGLSAGAVSLVTGTNWRLAFLVGLLPALLVFVVRYTIRETKPADAEAEEGAGQVETAPAQPQPEPRRGFSEFWSNRLYRVRALLGLVLAGVGLIAYWAIYGAGQDLARDFLMARGYSAADAGASAKKAYGGWQLAGGAVGMFAMGPLCSYLGRRGAFVLMQMGAIAATVLLCLVPTTYGMLIVGLMVMGFFVNGMHAGYAVWFPELFPTRLRATGAGICFNGGRILAASGLAFSAFIKGKLDLPKALMILAGLYVIGVVAAMMLPETRGKALED
jgi:MFS family permease